MSRHTGLEYQHHLQRITGLLLGTTFEGQNGTEVLVASYRGTEVLRISTLLSLGDIRSCIPKHLHARSILFHERLALLQRMHPSGLDLTEAPFAEHPVIAAALRQAGTIPASRERLLREATPFDLLHEARGKMSELIFSFDDVTIMYICKHSEKNTG